MNKNLISIIILILGIGTIHAEKTTSLTRGEAMPVLQNILRSYLPWKNVEFSGKVSTAKLPVSVSLKIYMEKDSLIQISGRVPLLGEMARINITPSSLVAINKHNKTYISENPENLLDMYPGFISDIQSILLARVVILGRGEISVENFDAIEIQKGGQNDWIVLPSEQYSHNSFSYGYLVDAAGHTRALMAAMSKLGTLQLEYSYKNRGEQIDVTIDRNGKKNELSLNFESVKWGGTRMKDINLSGYQRVSISQFMRNF